MWLFSRWLRSFWLMRWRPGPEEVGQWDGIPLAQAELDPAPIDSDPYRHEALQRALEHLPRLRAATGPDGAAHYQHTRFARRRRAEVAGTAGVVVAIRAAPWQTIAALRAARRLRREARASGSLLRAVVGLGRPGEVYLLGVWSDREPALRLLDSPVLRAVVHRWPNGCWANRWVPENEFGHWDGMRVRRSSALPTGPPRPWRARVGPPTQREPA